jgi:hypothetical protein
MSSGTYRIRDFTAHLAEADKASVRSATDNRLLRKRSLPISAAAHFCLSYGPGSRQRSGYSSEQRGWGNRFRSSA